MRNTVSEVLSGAALIVIMSLSGCAVLSSGIESVRGFGEFERSFIHTRNFTLTTYTKITLPGAPVRFYIEGDGRAWVSRTRLSDDPTPREPLVMGLSAEDPSPNVAYIARPGQYTENGVPGCDPAYWSDRRFSENVVSSMNEAMDATMKKAGSDKLELVGYSGGAAIAVLIAARREDVLSLRTIAGNLDPDAVNRYHKVSPMAGSFNPMDFAVKIKDVPQRHFVGAEDKIIPISVAWSFVERQGDVARLRVTVVKNATHTGGWAGAWRKMLLEPCLS